MLWNQQLTRETLRLWQPFISWNCLIWSHPDVPFDSIFSEGDPTGPPPPTETAALSHMSALRSGFRLPRFWEAGPPPDFRKTPVSGSHTSRGDTWFWRIFVCFGTKNDARNSYGGGNGIFFGRFIMEFGVPRVSLKWKLFGSLSHKNRGFYTEQKFWRGTAKNKGNLQFTIQISENCSCNRGSNAKGSFRRFHPQWRVAAPFQTYCLCDKVATNLFSSCFQYLDTRFTDGLVAWQEIVV